MIAAILARASRVVSTMLDGFTITVDTVDLPVSLDLYRARCDEVTRLTERCRRLEAELAAVESRP